jgi:uncharacterized membrane protein YfcA
MNLNLAFYIIVGFIAQLIDGALGMGYGVSSTSLLLSMGVSPGAASASVHASELVTTAVSGVSHLKFGNVDKDLLKRLMIPGILGGAIGAYILSELDGKNIKPFVSGYLMIMGILILWKAFKKVQENRVKTKIIPLGLFGGFFDAIGGGGWGPIVTTTLVARGNNPRLTIGSVNLAEFFVTVSESIVFVLTIGLVHWKIIIGLMIGGVLAAPLAALVCARIPRRPLMILVGILIVGLSIRTLLLTLP